MTSRLDWGALCSLPLSHAPNSDRAVRLTSPFKAPMLYRHLLRRRVYFRAAYLEKWKDVYRQSKVTREKGKGKCWNCSWTVLTFRHRKYLLNASTAFVIVFGADLIKWKQKINVFYPQKTEEKSLPHFHWSLEKLCCLHSLANIHSAPQCSRVPLCDPCPASEKGAKGNTILSHWVYCANSHIFFRHDTSGRTESLLPATFML